jgi:hypothetical protein
MYICCGRSRPAGCRASPAHHGHARRIIVETALLPCPLTPRSGTARAARATHLPAALLLLAALVLAHPAHAQPAAASHAHRVKLAPAAPPPLLQPYTWPARFLDGVGTPVDPLYARIDEFLRRARADLRGFGPAADISYPARTGVPAAAEKLASFAEQRPDLQDGATGGSCVVRFINYRLPWLMTPESAVHALPTLSMGAAGAGLHFDVMAGAIGGRSAAFGQFVLRF